jgi:hypothetical protein
MGHSNGGDGLRRKILSNIAVTTSDMFAMSTVREDISVGVIFSADGGSVRGLFMRK